MRRYLRWGAALSVVWVCVLVLAGGAGAKSNTFPDAVGDANGGAFDLTFVKVDDLTANEITIEVDVVFRSFTPTDAISAFIDTNRDSVEDYQAYVNGSGTCGLYQYDSATMSYDILVRANICIGGTSVFRFPRSDIGNPPDFQVYARSWYGSPPTNPGDRAPDSGWGLFDDTPPDTSISGGPSTTTTSTDATFSFTSDPGSTFQCSLDGAAYSACSSPAVYHGLSLGAHSFRVFGTDPSGNADASPAAYSWTVVDLTAPTAKAGAGSCCDTTGRATVSYTLGDNSGRASASVSIGRPGQKPAITCSYPIDAARLFTETCLIPASARGWLSFCVQAKDAAGNSSPASCRPLTFARLFATPSYGYLTPAGSQVLRITKFKVTNLVKGSTTTIKCRRCKLTSSRHPVGTRMSPGASIEVRVVKLRYRGTYTRLTNVRGSLVKKTACLPPGQSSPVISCNKRF